MKKSIIISVMLLFSATLFAQDKEFEFTVKGMSCDACAQGLTEFLKEMDGVESASVDFETETAKVVATDKITAEKIKEAVKSRNFEALFGGESLPKPLREEEKKGLDIEVIKGGDKIKIKDHLTEGKITIFDFYADWCGPCRVFSPKVERLLLDHPKVALKKVDIVDWKSGLSKQLTKEYQMPSLPFILIFDDKGNLLGKVAGNYIEKVEEIIYQNQK